MSDGNNKNLFGEVDDFNTMSAYDDIIDLDATENKSTRKAAKNTSRKTIKKVAKKKAVTKKNVKSKMTSRISAKKSVEKKTSSRKLTTKKKVTKRTTAAKKKNNTKSIEDEFLKITNIKSVDQVKKPRKIAFMISFYAVVAIAVIVFCLIRFSKPNKNNLLLEETVNYEYLTEEIVRTTERIVEESSSEQSELTESSEEEKKETTFRLLEPTTKSASSYKETTKSTSSYKETTTASASKKSVNDILPKYKDVIYPYPTYYQMTNEEITTIKNALNENYNIIKDKVFGEAVSFDNKGKNGIIYLNYTYLESFLNANTNEVKEGYKNLPIAPYYNYIMNDKFGFDKRTQVTNLSMKLNFKNASNQGEYYEIPASVYEPIGSNVSANGYNNISLRVLKRAKVGYTESFSLTSLLEVLDIECHTKHNPYFDIEDVIGANPKAVKDMKESGFNVQSMIEDEVFNYVVFDKKGYITALYMIKS